MYESSKPSKKIDYDLFDEDGNCASLEEEIEHDKEEEAKHLNGGSSDNGSPENTDKDDEEVNSGILSLRNYLAVKHENITPLIGTENNALLVPGEGLMIPGTGGVGKTLFVTSVAVSLTIGENILTWEVPRPLRVLIYQAEIPAQFYQKRLQPLYESYQLVNVQKACKILDNLFIAQVNEPFDIAAKDDTASEIIGQDVEQYKIDVVIIDPFLSFFRGNENDNNEVRRALDNVKHGVAEKYQCGLIITDHQPKYSGSDKNKEQQHSMRGAGAKRDWAASIIALNKTKTPTGQYGTFIKATVDKMRYGKEPKEPFTIRRDDDDFRHFLFRDDHVEPHEIARALDDGGGGLSKNKFCKLIEEEFSLNNRAGKAIIERAVEEGFIETKPGDRNSIVHNIGEKYIEWRNKQSATGSKKH